MCAGHRRERGMRQEAGIHRLRSGEEKGCVALTAWGPHQPWPVCCALSRQRGSEQRPPSLPSIWVWHLRCSACVPSGSSHSHWCKLTVTLRVVSAKDKAKVKGPTRHSHFHSLLMGLVSLRPQD